MLVAVFYFTLEEDIYININVAPKCVCHGTKRLLLLVCVH